MYFRHSITISTRSVINSFDQFSEKYLPKKTEYSLKSSKLKYFQILCRQFWALPRHLTLAKDCSAPDYFIENYKIIYFFKLNIRNTYMYVIWQFFPTDMVFWKLLLYWYRFYFKKKNFRKRKKSRDNSFWKKNHGVTLSFSGTQKTLSNLSLIVQCLT